MHARSMPEPPQNSPLPLLLGTGPDFAEADIARLDQQISAAGKHLGANHPRMIDARSRREALVRRLEVAREQSRRNSVASSISR